MPRTKKVCAADAALPSIPAEVFERVAKDPMTGKEVNAVSPAFEEVLTECCLGSGLSQQLRYPPGAEKSGDVSNHQNGVGTKLAPMVLVRDNGIFLVLGVAPDGWAMNDSGNNGIFEPRAS